MSASGRRRLIDLMNDHAEAALARQNKDGSMPPGCNGPYGNPETPVRNTAHWLITLSALYQINGDQRYLDAADRLAAYLADPARRPYGFSFHCRTGAMDHCNGLIGQAWAMEGLAAAARLFSNDRFTRIALDVFNKHKFDRRLGLWHRLEPDGRVIGLDPTFNHQLWFAATAAELLTAAGDIAHPDLMRFMDQLKDSFVVSGDGRIRHLIYRAIRGKTLKQAVRRPISLFSKTFGIKLLSERIDRGGRNELLKEIGYQCFNLYAFARLNHFFPHLPLFKFERFHAAVQFLESVEYRNAIRDNRYAYGYNAPGFEVPLCLSEFSSKDRTEMLHDAQYWIESQFSATYNLRTQRFDRNTDDPETLSARLYECSRFPEDILRLNVSNGLR